MNIRSRWFLLFAGLMSATMIVAAACSSGTGSGDKTKTAAAGTGGKTPAAGATTSASGDQAPADQQKLVAQSVEPIFYDPQRSNFEQDIAVERMLFRGLYNLTDDGSGGVKVVNEMAEGDPQVVTAAGVGGGLAAPPAAGETVYKIKIKSGLKWSDGSPLTATDFAFGLVRACDPAVADPYQYILGAGLMELKGCDELTANKDASKTADLIAAIGAVGSDATTLTLTTGRVVPNLKTLLSLWVSFPSPKAVIDKVGDKWSDVGNIISNGPFILTEVVAKDHATLKPNPQWTGKKPALQVLTIKFIDDLEAAFKAFQTGELGMSRITAADNTVAKKDSSLKDLLVPEKTTRIDSIETLMTDPVLKDFNVRLALSRSIDRVKLNESVYDGLNTPATYWVVKGIAGHQGDVFDKLLSFDATAAKKALSDAGYADGKGFPTIKLLMRDDPEQRNLADFLIKGWKDTLGITVQTEFVDGKTRGARNNAHDFQLFRGGWQTDYPDIENTLSGQFSTGGGNNQWLCSDPEIDAAYKDVNAATDAAAQVKAYQKVETLVIQKLCGVIPFQQITLPYLVKKNVGGVTPNGIIDAGQPGNYCAECWFIKK